MGWEYNHEQKVASYLRLMSTAERRKLAEVELEMRIEMDTQLIIGRENYEKLLFETPGTKEFRHEARRAMKKPKQLVRLAQD